MNHGHAATNAVNDINQQRRIVMITLGKVSTETKSAKSGTIPETVFPQQYQTL